MSKTVLVTGGLGFIGSELVHQLVLDDKFNVYNLDACTYAANPASLASLENHANYHYLNINTCDRAALHQAFTSIKPDAVMHLAAETHVDRSIDAAGVFIQTNIIGTYNMLEESLAMYQQKGDAFRFIHISTDEVFGSLGFDDKPFSETTPYDPSSPYSASKASSDHLVRAWHRTFGLPAIITNCSNNYGPRQFPEKLIPTMIIKMLNGEPLPVYGKGLNVRDWLYVEDHAHALRTVLAKGTPGQTYCVGGNAEVTNIDIVKTLCRLVEQEANVLPVTPLSSLITYVADRPGHDLRYAIDASKIKAELGWEPTSNFEQGMLQTVRWYLNNKQWWQPIYSSQRLGTI